MTKHVYAPSDIIKMKDAVSILRKLQEQIEDDNEAYGEIDGAMSGIEMIIDRAEGEAE